MSYRLLLRLSSWFYRKLKAGGISIPVGPYKRAQRKRLSKGKWGELKTALFDQIQASKQSKDTTLFTYKLIGRIEEVERERPSHPLVDAVFSSGPALREKIESDLAVSTDQLNESQKEALTKAHKNKVLFILGAAGTGKTRVLSRIVGDFVTAGETTLLCCHTKAAVDHATDRLEPSVREASGFKAKTFASVVMDQDTTSVQNVVIDEASMASLPHILFLTSLASKRVIFCGDPMQLPPIARSGELSEKWLKRDIFGHQSGTEDIRELYSWNYENQEISVFLREQFDIPRRIFSIANHLYYRDRLNCQSRSKGIISFIDTSEQNPPLTGTRSSPINEAHAEIVTNQAEEALKKRTLTADTIGILTPFRAQQKYLKDLLSKRGIPGEVAVDTVHTLQGRKKSCIILDLVASAVDHTFQNLGGSRDHESQAVRMLNTALSRCRTHAGTEGRFIVVANYQHIKDLYPDSAVLQFLNRIRFQSDSLTNDEGISRFQQTTDTLIREIREDHLRIVKSLEDKEAVSEHAVDRLIWSYCDVIPRQIQLCNRLKPSFHETDGTRDNLEQLPGSARRFAEQSGAWVQDNPGAHRPHFKDVIGRLHQILWETTMVKTAPGMKNIGPSKPVYDPDASDGESYGRIRIWLNNLRNFYDHDITQFPPEDEKRIRLQVKQFFTVATSKPEPENSLDYLRALLVILADVVWYLDTVREKLKNQV
jgi:hypothetical protein